MFSVYMEALHLNLIRANLGCHIGDLFMGVLGYADDVIIAPYCMLFNINAPYM